MKKSYKENIYKDSLVKPEMIVAEVIKIWPQTLDVFIKTGFSPLKNPVFRNTIGKKITIKQASKFRNVDMNILLANLQNAVSNPTGHHVSFIDQDRLRFDENAVPDLKGDIRLLGLVPCPLSNILYEKLDSFIHGYSEKNEIKTGWWISSEGTGSGDVKNFIKTTMKSKQAKLFPEVFIATGTELFFHEEYLKNFYRQKLFHPAIPNSNRRSEFAKLEDPDGFMNLQFAVLFTFSCDTRLLGDLPIPGSWHDLYKPIYRDNIAIPSLNLPIMPDFLASLYYYFGDNAFIRFSRNVLQAIHPSRTKGRNREKQPPAIVVTPLHFAKIQGDKYQVMITPEDGYLALPAYIAGSGNSKEHSKKFISYLLSEEYLSVYYRYGSFIPNHKNIPVNVKLDQLIFRPWHSIYNNPDILFKELLYNFRLEKL